MQAVTDSPADNAPGENRQPDNALQTVCIEGTNIPALSPDAMPKANKAVEEAYVVANGPVLRAYLR